jgi:hypothetical protein
MNKGEISFYFQQKKYIWDADKKQFVKLRYPSDSHPPMKTFQSYNGLTTEKDIAAVTEKYDLNRLVLIQLDLLNFKFFFFLGLDTELPSLASISLSQLLLNFSRSTP